jgi:hypothetical protein
MEFGPHNKIVQLCLKGMEQEQKEKPAEAMAIFLQAWKDSTDDFEKFLAAWFVSRQQHVVSERLTWLQRSLDFALKINDASAHSALPALYSNMASCYDSMGDHLNSEKFRSLSDENKDKVIDEGPFYHGTKADLKSGDLLTPGSSSNYKDGLVMNHIYFTALLNGAGLAASLAKGEGAERVYVVQPTGRFENDPNVTDKKFPGNLTRSYRSSSPLKISGEINDWKKQTPEQLKEWKDKLAKNQGEIIN